MDAPTLESKVEALLTNKPQSARDILRALKGSGSLSEEQKKKAVNSLLYKLLKDGKAVKTDGTPPFWTKPTTGKSNSGSEDESSEEMVTGVFIDVTNSPCHKEAIKYASETTPVYIFANAEYPAELPKASQFVSVTTTAEGETVSSEMIVRATTFVCAMKAVNRPVKVLIVSSANAMTGLDRMLKVAVPNLDVEVVKDGWETLKLSLE